MAIRILGTGRYLPERVVTNDDLAVSLDTTDEWIFSHTGIRSRHVAGEGESTSTLAAAAARNALDAAGLGPDKIDLIIVATSTPDYATFPSTACLVQAALGCFEAGAYDLQAACAGFVYALEQARGYVTLHPGKKVLVIGAECLSRIMDWSDRSVCILFGDGAGAVVVGDDDEPRETVSASETVSLLGADGRGYDFILRTGGTRDPRATDPVSGLPAPVAAFPKLTLQGHDVFAFAVRKLAQLVEVLCRKQGVAPTTLDRIFAHQANSRIIEATARRLKLPLDRFWLDMATTANTSAASIPIALDHAVRDGELRDGMKIALVGFGSGLSYGGLSTVWPYL